jgi:predicted DNA-binding ribbon-helix-helix protein
VAAPRLYDYWRRFGFVCVDNAQIGAGSMKSAIVKRSVVLAGHKTSVSLEEPFWQGLKDIAQRRHQPLSELIASIDAKRDLGNLSSAVRLFVLNYYQGRFGMEHRHSV